MDIVIGYQGRDHVKAEQLRRMIAGMAGDGTYVLGTQNELAATMVTANQVRIDTGDVVAAGGAYATVETPETLVVESGVTGQKRNDVVVARYEKDASTNVESMELAVVKGTPVSYGDPTDPELADGSIMAGDSPVEVPLWRIPIDGLAPGTPVKLFDTIPTIDSLRDSVSRIVTGTVTKSIKQPSGTSWAYVTAILSYDEIESLIGRPFDVTRDQFFATNVRWDTCQVLALPFVQSLSRGGTPSVAVITPTGQSGGGQTKSLTIGWTIIKGE